MYAENAHVFAANNLHKNAIAYLCVSMHMHTHAYFYIFKNMHNISSAYFTLMNMHNQNTHKPNTQTYHLYRFWQTIACFI